MSEEYSINKHDLNYRSLFTKVRGGWTKEKIIKQLKTIKCLDTDSSFHREIALYDNPTDFGNNLYYHGSGNFVRSLKPSIILKNIGNGDGGGGGYGEQYYGISLSKDRDMASNFTGLSNYGSVAPVLLRKSAIVKVIKEFKDANYIEDVIEDLWNEGIDAVIIGDHSRPQSEQEIVILNPKCIVVGKPTSFKVLDKKPIPSFNEEEIKDMWINSSSKYKELCLISSKNHKEYMEKKYGKPFEISDWNSKMQNVFGYHQQNLKKYNENHNENIKSFLLDKNSEKELKIKGLRF